MLKRYSDIRREIPRHWGTIFLERIEVLVLERLALYAWNERNRDHVRTSPDSFVLRHSDVQRLSESSIVTSLKSKGVLQRRAEQDNGVVIEIPREIVDLARHLQSVARRDRSRVEAGLSLMEIARRCGLPKQEHAA